MTAEYFRAIKKLRRRKSARPRGRTGTARHAIGVNISDSPPQYVPATYFAMAPPREFTSSFW